MSIDNFKYRDYINNNERSGCWCHCNPCRPVPCCCVGPPGPRGPVGTILGSYDTLADLIREHATGSQGDTYLVDGELYVWNTETQAWERVGNLQGPTGPTGPVATILDSYDTLADLIREHPTGSPGEIYIAGGEIHVWNTETQAWESIGSFQGPTGPSGPAGPTAPPIYAQP